MTQPTQPVNYIRHLSIVVRKMGDDDRFTANHVSLYVMLFHQWNAQRFPARLLVYRNELMQASKIRNPNSYTTCLKNLHAWGYLQYFPSRSKYEASQVIMATLTEIDKCDDKGADNGTDKGEGDNLPHFDNGADKDGDNGVDKGSGTIIINSTKPSENNSNFSNKSLAPLGHGIEMAGGLGAEGEEAGAAPEERKKVAPKKKEPAGRGQVIPDLLFGESPCAGKDFFKQAFAGTEYERANLDYYHEVIGNWSRSKDARKKDWIAAAKNWMLNDYRAGKLVTQTTVPSLTAYGKATVAPARARTGVDLDALFALIDHAHSPK
jgi:hypothetical protein